MSEARTPIATYVISTSLTESLAMTEQRILQRRLADSHGYDMYSGDVPESLKQAMINFSKNQTVVVSIKVYSDGAVEAELA
jgi:hypothetical protein